MREAERASELKEDKSGVGEKKGEKRVLAARASIEKPTRVWPDTHTSGPTHTGRRPAGAFSFASRESEISQRVRACMHACWTLVPLVRAWTHIAKDNTRASHARLVFFFWR